MYNISNWYKHFPKIDLKLLEERQQRVPNLVDHTYPTSYQGFRN